MDYAAIKGFEGGLEQSLGHITGAIMSYQDRKRAQEKNKADAEKEEKQQGLIDRKMMLDESEKGLQWDPVENKYNFTEEKKKKDEMAAAKAAQESAYKEREFGLKERDVDLKAAALAQKQAQKPKSLLEDSLDKKTGAEMADWVTRGKAATQNNVSVLDEAIGMMENNEGAALSGAKYGLLPESVINMTNPDALQVKRLANQVSVQNLREAMGPAFTEKEGQLFMSLDYDPKASPDVNLKNLQRKRNMIVGGMEKRDAMLSHLNKGGSVLGFQQDKGLMNEPMKMVTQPAAPTQGRTPEEDLELAELKKLANSRMNARQ